MNRNLKITSQLNKIKPALKKQYRVNKIGLFGSQITGRYRPDSDIDILVNFSGPIGLFRLVELQDFLSQHLKHRVDLVPEKSLKPHIGKYIRQQVSYI